jgi:enediyne biosynthesis protein E4
MKNTLIIVLSAVSLFACTKSPRFQQLKADFTGVSFKNQIEESDSLNVINYEYIYNGAGVGVGDLNNDGLADLVFAGNQVSTKIYLNEGKFKFRDITANFAALGNNQWYSGVAMVDINGDGWLDVYLTSTANHDPSQRKNRLWVSQGAEKGKDPTYIEMAEQYGIAEDGQSVNAAFFDYDLDGDLDLYVLNNTLNQRMNANYRFKITDGTAPNNDQLYRNNGDGTFTRVTREAGIVFEGFGLGLAMGDVNKDGYPDMYVSNDFISNDLLYINQGNGTFKNEIRKYMSYQTKSSMGDDMADINNDGFLDMYTLDMLPETYLKKRQTINGFSYMFYSYDAKYDYEHQYLRNMLHMHNGLMNGEMLPYSEVGQMLGIQQTEWSWSPLFADYDNDGDKDLIVANGYPLDMTDKDWTKYQAEVLGFVSDAREVASMAPPIKVPNMAFENKGELSFANISDEWLPRTPSFSYGASFVDLDNDGDLDYVANNINDEAFIWRNNTIERDKTKTHYLRLRLEGSQGNTGAIGAKVTLWCKGQMQYSEHFLSRGFASSVDPVIHFGLGENKVVDSLKVIWPASHKVTMVKNLEANQLLVIREKEALPEPPVVKHKSSLMFSRAEGLIDYVHEQTDFADFFLNQRIIPHKFSQIGPILATGDLNGDGLKDLIIGSTNVLPTEVYVSDGKGYKMTQFSGLTEKKPFSEGDLAILDIDNDGDMDVIAVAGGYENDNEKEYKHIVYLNDKGSFTPVEIPIPQFPSGVLRPFDFDHDGDVDLFIGSRVKKGMYPAANHSWLVHNDKGTLSTHTSDKLDLGMVTDAVWTDYDKDGWEDLLVMREWNSPLLLKNVNGKELVPVKNKEMDDHKGWWYSVVAGDFDNDGDDDYLMGNLGENHRFHVSSEYPLQMYAIDLDNNGSLEPLFTAYWKDDKGKMTEYPVNYFDELAGQTKFFQKLFKSYKEYSYGNIHDMLDANTLKRLEFKLSISTTSSCIVWNDKGSFRFEKMPPSLQVSPITRMLVRDLNGDGIPDAVVGGNDYSFDIATGYYDANKGFVLLSKGAKQGFEVLPPAKSGLLLKGMVQSLQFIGGDTLMLVAGMNRDRIAVYKQMSK